MAYKYLDGITTADVAFEAEGTTLEDMFKSSALALEEVQVELSTVHPFVTRAIVVDAPNIENLLFKFLQELVYYKDAEQLLFNEFTISIRQMGVWTLKCVASGEVITLGKHKLGTDIKAVTLHQFKVEQTPAGWKAQVVLDI